MHSRELEIRWVCMNEEKWKLNECPEIMTIQLPFHTPSMSELGPNEWRCRQNLVAMELLCVKSLKERRNCGWVSSFFDNVVQ